MLIDDSLSMTIVDHYAEKPRKAMAERLRGSGLGAAELSRWNLLRTLTAEHDGESAARNRRRPQIASLFRHRRAAQPASGRARHRRGTAIVGPEGGNDAVGRRRAGGARRLARRHAGRRRRADRRHQHRRADAGRRGRARPATRRAALLRRPRQRSPRPRSETLRSDRR